MVRRGAITSVASALGAAAGWVAAFHARLGFGVLVGAAIAILVFASAETVFLGVLAAQPWSGLLAFPTATLTVTKLLGLLAVASWLVATATGRLTLRYTAPIGWALAFFGVVVFSLMVSPDPAAGMQKTISYALYVTFPALFAQIIRGGRKVRRALIVYGASATLAAGYALVQFLQGSISRAAGPISDPNDFAFVLAPIVPVVCYFMLTGRRRLVWGGALAVLLATMLATLSRGALIGFLAVVLWAVATRRISLPGFLAALITVGGVLAIALFLYQPLIHERLAEKQYVASKNAASRLALWSAATRMALDHPVAGIGPGRFGAESQSYLLNNPSIVHDVVHNSYLEILAEDGAFALLLFLGFLASVWRALRSVRRAAVRLGDRAGRHLSDALQASFLWAVVSAAFISGQVAIPLWFIGGVAASLALAARAQPVSPAQPLALPAPAPLGPAPQLRG